MRRRAGISGIQQKEREKKILLQKGNEIATKQIDNLKDQLVSFKNSLETIAQQHGDKIKADPKFRSEFHKMCMLVGADPLLSKKNALADFFGFGDFYCQLGIQIIDICISTRALNSGFMDIEELQHKLQLLRKKTKDKITVEDIESSITQLLPLSGGFKIIKVGNRKFVQSVPHEFSQDHIEIFRLFQLQIMSTFDQLSTSLGWNITRLKSALDSFLKQGLLWVDEQESPVVYWSTFYFEEYNS
ncbi:hypothetical protein BB561_006357 [Smittium simulii]|uniref:Vacuolar-sorting protein SNF8 n=1 Tax=Smittium simulii TaxID=133385 RepID=A0A2T9Y4Y7_9FUNG|nr:hypothetical protein BB561_006357 [Smittium simulii]